MDNEKPREEVAPAEMAVVMPAAQEDTTQAASPIGLSDEPYSIYTKREKWFIVGMVAVAGFYSPLPANIYFPAIPTLSREFGVSIEALNLSVTTYLIFQGVAPMFWGPLSDRYGRRPIYLGCFIVLIGSCIGLALCPTDAYWLLLVLRCLQAAGCTSALALGMGVCGDISIPEERAGFVGTFNLGPMLSPCIAPAIGGALAQKLGWRSIFWFLVIISAACLAFIWVFLPETLRALAGNGSVPMKGVYRPVVPVVGTKHRYAGTTSRPPKKKVSMNPFLIFALPDITISLIFAGVIFAVNYTILSTIGSAFAEAYPWLSQTALGLAYLPTGVGMMVGSTIVGRVLDWDYARIKNKIAAEDEGRDFPKEYARLRLMPAHMVIFAILAISWAWCIEKRVNIAVPLVLQVILGWPSVAILNTVMTLNVDVLQKRSSSATACTNFVRCLMGAVLVSVINKMTGRLGYGWTYVLLGGVCLLMLPLMYVVMKIGPRWRKRREQKEEAQALAEAEAEAEGVTGSEIA